MADLFDSLSGTLDSVVSDAADSVGGFISDKVTDVTGQAAPNPPASPPVTVIPGTAVPVTTAAGGTLAIAAIAAFLLLK